MELPQSLNTQSARTESEMTAIQRIGLVTLIGAGVTGACGVFWTLYPAFVADDDADYAGPASASSMGDNMIWFALLAIAGAAMGVAMMIVGRKSGTTRMR